MRWNEAEVCGRLNCVPDWQGLLRMKSSSPSSNPRPSKLIAHLNSGDQDFKLRYFRLHGNLLFYFRVTPLDSASPSSKSVPGASEYNYESKDPLGLVVLENYHVQREGFESGSNHAFSVIFGGSLEIKRLTFLTETSRSVDQWIQALKKSSYEVLRNQLLELQIKILNKTGKDPLRGTGFENNPKFCLKPDKEDIDGVIEALDLLPNPPKPKPRKNKKKTSSNHGGFTSHVTENWESINRPEIVEERMTDLVENKKTNKPTFKSHVPEGNLINF